MDQEEFNQRLSRISTLWTVVLQAHQGSAEAVTKAQQLLMQRYSGAVYRYLLGAVRDPDVAADLSQEFALRFVRGDFRRAAPERGRFRDYVKIALVHLVDDYYRSRRARPRQLAAGDPEPAAPAPQSPDTDRDFLNSWQAEILERTWKALAEAQPMYHAVLLYRVENAEVTSPQMAEHLSARLGKPLTADGVRKTLQRAHHKFADLLVDEVACSLEAPTIQELRKELAELDLLRYCESALERRGSAPASESDPP